MSEKLRVALLISSLKAAGAERVTLNLAEGLSRLGVTVDVLTMTDEGELFHRAGRPYSTVNLACTRTYQLFSRLNAYVRDRRPDVLVVSFWKLSLVACLVRLVRRDFRLLVWEHGSPSLSPVSPTWLYAILSSMLYRTTERIVAVSEAVAEDVRKITWGLSRRIAVIYNPVPPPDHLTGDGDGERAASRLVFTGRFERPKHPELLIEALPHVLKERPVTVEFVGRGELRPSLERLAHELGVAEHVAFSGYLPDPYVALGRADLLVLTSYQEGLPTVVVEALHAGLGVVGSDCPGGIAEILEHGQYGTLVPLDDAAALADAILKELAHPRDPAKQQGGGARFLPERAARAFLSAAGLSVPEQR